MRNLLTPTSSRCCIAALFCVTSAALVVVPLTGYAQDSRAPTELTEEQRVLATEDEYVAAEVNRDEATLRRIIDERFQFNSSHGTTTGKEDLVQGVMKMAMTGQVISERSVLIEGNIALIFGTAELQFGGPGEEKSVSTLRYTSTYVKRQDQWRMLALQMQSRAAK